MASTDRLAPVLRIALLVLVLFVALEISARSFVFGLAGLDPRKVGLLSDVHPRDLVTFDTEPDIVFEYAAGLDLYFKLVPFRTNSRGLRDREYPLDKPSGTRRAVVLGSSFSLPAGVAIEDAYHSRLEERFAGWEFINLAVGMHLPGQFIAVLRHRGLAYDPDLILLGLTSMAAPRMLGAWDHVPPREVLDLVHAGPRSIFAQVVRTRAGWIPRAFPSSRPEFPAQRADAQGRDVITKLAEIQQTTNVPIVVIRLELGPQPPAPVEREIARRVRDAGLGYLDTRTAFRGRRTTDLWIYELDPHPNAAAHAIFAETIGEFLIDQGHAGATRQRPRPEP